MAGMLWSLWLLYTWPLAETRHTGHSTQYPESPSVIIRADNETTVTPGPSVTNAGEMGLRRDTVEDTVMAAGTEMVLTKNSPGVWLCLISVARAGLPPPLPGARNYQVCVGTSNFQYSLRSHIQHIHAGLIFN